MKRIPLVASLLFVFLSHACAQPAAPAPPREGFISTADGVRLFYRVVGSGP